MPRVSDKVVALHLWWWMSCLSTYCGEFASYFPMHAVYFFVPCLIFLSIVISQPVGYIKHPVTTYVSASLQHAVCVFSFLFLFCLQRQGFLIEVVLCTCDGCHVFRRKTTVGILPHTSPCTLSALVFYGSYFRSIWVVVLHTMWISAWWMRKTKRDLCFLVFCLVSSRLCFVIPAAYCVFFTSFCVAWFLRCSAQFEYCVFKLPCCKGRRKMLWRFHVTFSLVAVFLLYFRPYFSGYEVPCIMWIVIGLANEEKPNIDVLYFSVFTPACLAPFLW